MRSASNFCNVNNNGNANNNNASNSNGVRPDFTTVHNWFYYQYSNGKGKVIHSAVMLINNNSDAPGYVRWSYKQGGFYMNNNKLTDANNIWEAGTKAMKGSKFKYQTQLYEMNQLVETAILQRQLKEGIYRPQEGIKFPINERGKLRYITSNAIQDKAMNHVLCDNVITPSIKPFLIYDNGASQKGKGVSFTRKRLEVFLRKYFMETGSNEGYILQYDFSGYYANILHEKCMEILMKKVSSISNSEEEKQLTESLISLIFQSFEMDVSYMTDKEIDELYCSKVDSRMNESVPAELLTGTKMLKKGVDIGNQLSQDIGIVYPYRIDNYVKIVRGCKYYGRYTDDGYIIHQDKEFLKDVLSGIKQNAQEYGIIINENKTQISKLSSGFRFLQISYRLTDTGKVVKRINPKNVTRERRKLKAYKRKLDAKELDYETIENSFKSWMGSNWRVMSRIQIRNMSRLYFELFERKIKYKKNARLNWLLEHA